MADVIVSYKGSNIATMSASGTKTLETAGTYCEDDIEITYNSPGGGGQIVEADLKDVNFYDYDGFCLYSYTASEFADLTALPANPSHDGLTAQGWNWSLADAKTYVSKYKRLNIGQCYITSDGKTRIYVELQQGRLSPTIGLGVNGTVVVDWGDGSSTSTITGTSTGTLKTTSHTYLSPGNYVIVLTVSGTATSIYGNSSSNSYLFIKSVSSLTRENRSYLSAIKKIEIGEKIQIGNYAFFYCYGLKSLTIPALTNIGNYAFGYCISLQHLTLPYTLPKQYGMRYCYSLQTVSLGNTSNNKGIGPQNFQYCYALQSIQLQDTLSSLSINSFSQCESLPIIIIPENITNIANSTFANCYALGEIHFTRTTPPTVNNSNAWSNIPSDCKIYVPTGSLSAYTSATNYPSSSTYTYIEE